jgi:hypothetical protein
MHSTKKASKFERISHIFNSEQNYDWMNSHAANPTPIHLGGDTYRIFFSSRDANNRSHVAFLDYDINLRKIERVSDRPSLRPGPKGYFDDSGTSPGCIIIGDSGEYLLYYMGWNLMVTVPFLNTIGLAVGNDLETFEKYNGTAILDRNPLDPICLSYPWVLKDGDRWRMWYGSTDSWATEEFEMQHFFSHAYSEDGKRWQPTGHVSLPRAHNEYAFTRPCVLKDGDIFKMWFTVRGEQYVIGYAESVDGFEWSRGENALVGSGEGWDSDSVSYASVFDHDGSRYMLYAGNKYGKTGFGIAVLSR